uniref:Uncharacterized protein n=1 Tax=candidate division WOR-3 bacterium TaxID=2052148 RepID=A0A7C3YZK2_UNCW3
MAVRNALRRKEKYEIKLDPDVVKQRFSGQKEKMVDQIADIFPSLVALEEAAKTVLDAEGVPISLYPMYLDYARELWRLVNKFGGDVLYNETRILENKWVARALSQPVLERLRVEIFGITLPPAP